MELWKPKKKSIFTSPMGVTPESIPVGNVFRQTDIAYPTHFIYEGMIEKYRWTFINAWKLFDEYEYVGTIIPIEEKIEVIFDKSQPVISNYGLDYLAPTKCHQWEGK